jgi:hypothetical protein
MTKPTKTRKTRLKGTETEKPCKVVKRDGSVHGCLKTKNRFTDFKPRWAGCSAHKTEGGRRFFEPGCADCAKVVNGNIRQPYCIECDSSRPKKAGAATPKPKAKATPKAKPKPVATVNPTPEPKAEPVAEATPVVVPAPVAKKGKQPKTSQKPKRPKLATMADLSALFSDES